MVCRTPDSAPIKVADPEAVGDLLGAAAARQPEQRRAQGAGGGGPWLEAAVGGDVLGRPQVHGSPPRLDPSSRGEEWGQRTGEEQCRRTGEEQGRRTGEEQGRRTGAQCGRMPVWRELNRSAVGTR